MSEPLTTLDFKLPRRGTNDRFFRNMTVTLSTDLKDRIIQMINWLTINSYWYYVLDKSVVTDEEFDIVKKLVTDTIFANGAKMFGLDCFPNLFWGRTPCHFPPRIKAMFNIMAWYHGDTTGPRRTKEEIESRATEAQRLTRQNSAGFVIKLNK